MSENPLKAPRHLRAATRRWWESVVAAWQLEQHHVRLLTLAAGGSAWICKSGHYSTGTEPSHDCFRLLVKRGRDGRDAR